MKVSIDSSLCRRCGRCAQVCPAAVITTEKGEVPVIHETRCISCGHCVDVCDAEAISHADFPASAIHSVQTDLLPSPRSLMELIRSRRSNRTITSRPIPEEAMADILEAARYAPTSENSGRVVLTVLDEKAIREVEDATMRFFLRLRDVLMSPLLKPLTRLFLPDLYAEAPELERFRVRWERGECPCACNCTRMLIFSAPTGYDFGFQDCNLAYQNASLMAEAHGISQVYMGLIQVALKFMGNRKARKLLHLPAGHKPYALMALGVPAFRYARYTERH